MEVVFLAYVCFFGVGMVFLWLYLFIYYEINRTNKCINNEERTKQTEDADFI